MTIGKNINIYDLSFKKFRISIYLLLATYVVTTGQLHASGTDEWYKSFSNSEIDQINSGVRWSPVKKPTTIHRYFDPVNFNVGESIEFSMQWRSDGVSAKSANDDIECATRNPTNQGEGISDRYLSCLAGTGDFRIGFFQSSEFVGNDSCDGNRKKTNCPSDLSPNKKFNDYKGFQFRIHPHLSRGFKNQDGRFKEKKSDGSQESHINISLWSRIKPGENGLMSDECQAIDHCGFSKSDDWGTQPQSWGPDVPFGEARTLLVRITRVNSEDYNVDVTLNGQQAPLLTGRFTSEFTPNYFDTIAVTYTNSSRAYEYVEITDFNVNGSPADPDDGDDNSPDPDQLVVNLQQSSTSNYAIKSFLATNAKVYVDRDYTYQDLGMFSGSYFIQTANDDDNLIGDQLFSVDLLKPAYVYVLFDHRKVQVPGWLSTYHYTGDTVSTNDTLFHVYEQRYNAGTVVFGENGRESGDSMYTVLVLPDNEDRLHLNYRFEGNLGDESDYELDAIGGGSISYSTIEAEGSKALKLEQEEQDYIALPTAIFDAEDFTFAAWVRWDGGDAWQRIFSYGRDTDNVMFLTVADSKGKLRFRIEQDGNKEEIRSNFTLKTKRYYHVAVVLQDGIARLLVDGVEVASNMTTSNNVMGLGATDFWIGKSRFNDPYFDGRIDDLHVVNKALSNQEIKALMDE